MKEKQTFHLTLLCRGRKWTWKSQRQGQHLVHPRGRYQSGQSTCDVATVCVCVCVCVCVWYVGIPSHCIKLCIFIPLAKHYHIISSSQSVYICINSPVLGLSARIVQTRELSSLVKSVSAQSL